MMPHLLTQQLGQVVYNTLNVDTPTSLGEPWLVQSFFFLDRLSKPNLRASQPEELQHVVVELYYARGGPRLVAYP